MEKDNSQLSTINCQFKFGSKEISYELTFEERKTLGIRVYPNGKVKVLAPYDTSEEKLYRKLREKAPWIIKQQLDFLAYHPLTPERRYLNGETHLYLGRQYRLSIEHVEGTVVKDVKLKSGRIIVFTSDSSTKHIAGVLRDWYRKRAEEWFEKLLPICKNKFSRQHQLSMTTYELSMREMPTRWGSCTPKGKIILNPALIKASKGCIEYVIVHELCHLIHHNHTKAFYELLESIMPDWKKWKEQLDQSV